MAAAALTLGCVGQIVMVVLVTTIVLRTLPLGPAMAIAAVAAEGIPAYALVRVWRGRLDNPRVASFLVVVFAWMILTAMVVYFSYVWIAALPSI